eukprot:COSAG02_NODE_28792_length_582_cov_1.068323_2_plen_39_part_01
MYNTMPSYSGSTRTLYGTYCIFDPFRSESLDGGRSYKCK